MRSLIVCIKRYDPERDDSPRWEAYQVEADSMDRVLDVLLRIKWEQDETLALRYSCAHGSAAPMRCGSTASIAWPARPWSGVLRMIRSRSSRYSSPR